MFVLKEVAKFFHLVCDEGPNICSLILTIGSLFLIVVSLPLSLFCVVKVVQESIGNID